MSRDKKKNKGKSILYLLLIVCVFTGGFYSGVKWSEHNSAKLSENPVIEDENIEEKDPVKVKDPVEDILSEMTLEEKVYQMFFVEPEVITGVVTVIAAGEASKEAVKKYPVGGLIYFAKNFENREQTETMLKNMQSYSKIPLFLGVDEEGGIVSRLGSNEAMEFKKQPPMREIGDTKDPEKAYIAGKELGEELYKLGFNLDFAPVADVLVNSSNKEIGSRSFGTEPDNVANMVEKLVAGLEENNIYSVLKHFPGHGSTTTDSHEGYSKSTRTLEQLRETEFLPFKSGMAAGSNFVMISHMTLVNATEEKVPCSVSKEVITDMLKTELGYNGIIITDSFRMGAITDKYTSAQAAVKAVKAGVDMVLMPQSLSEAHKGIIDAVKSGEITEERIDESVRKILTVKSNKGLIK